MNVPADSFHLQGRLAAGVVTVPAFHRREGESWTAAVGGEAVGMGTRIPAGVALVGTFSPRAQKNDWVSRNLSNPATLRLAAR